MFSRVVLGMFQAECGESPDRMSDLQKAYFELGEKQQENRSGEPGTMAVHPETLPETRQEEAGECR